VVAETYDGVLNDINGQHIRSEHVFEAIEGATGCALAEGNVGGGTGMICYDFKGGTGTASRRVGIGNHTYTMGALVQANHGTRDWLTILGVPVGRHLQEDQIFQQERGSIVVVLGTDIPMLPHQLERLARRAALGIARHGTPGGNNSGDLFLAFSTANPLPPERLRETELALNCVPDEHFDPIYLAAVEATEEAVVNAMLAAEDMPAYKPRGRICRAISHAALVEIMARYGRLVPQDGR
jgi:D-aminopeptidase